MTTVDVDSDLETEMEIPLFGLSSYYAAVVMATLAHSAIMAVDVAATMAVAIVVFGLSFSSSSAVADVVVTDSANSQIVLKREKTASNEAVFFIIIDLQ